MDAGAKEQSTKLPPRADNVLEEINRLDAPGVHGAIAAALLELEPLDLAAALSTLIHTSAEVEKRAEAAFQL